MKNLLILLFFACFCNSLFCQYDQKTKAGDSINITTPRYFNNTSLKTTNLYAGYKIGGKDKHTNHTLDIGITRNKTVRGQHYASSGYYAANEFVFSSDGFTIGPKIGYFASFAILCVGADVICYTDFSSTSTHLAPYFGFGGSGMRLYISPHIPLYNKDLKNTDYISIGISVDLFSISQKGLKFGPWKNL